jgi:(E)-4-hydroxy-3-methylbut-2-enyl-diphosphate synthase
VDLISLAGQVEECLRAVTAPVKVAVMGCVVNGPGEAREADYGIAGGKDCGMLFRKGEILGRVDADRLCDALIELIRKEEGLE